MITWTVADVLNRLPRARSYRALSKPLYKPSGREKNKEIALAVESMRMHMTDEGWQLMQGLENAGYELFGHGLPGNYTSVKKILELAPPDPPNITCVVQDKREWDVQPGAFREYRARFTHVEELARHSDIFRLTVVKDAHQNPPYHAASAQEIGCHAWIIYYHPKIVNRLAWYTRPEHCIRTYHSLNPDHIPSWQSVARKGCILSGAISNAYPLRQKIARNMHMLPNLYVKPHPGYHRDKCETPGFIKELTNYKVAICTASIYGYSLRKLIEATAAGCVVVTDLPQDDVMPGIDDNLIRVHPDISLSQMSDLLNQLQREYNPHVQEEFARIAIEEYSYQNQGRLLAESIRNLRSHYNDCCTVTSV